MLFSLYSGFRLRFCAAVSLALLALASTTALAQSGQQSITLSEAIANTLVQNPQLHQFKIKREGLVARRENNNLRPELNLGIEVENFGGSGELSGTQSAETTVSISSVIELGGKRSARVSVVNAQVQMLDAHRQAFTLDVLGELTSVFIQALEVQERIELAKEARHLAQSTLNSVKNRSQQGASPEYEVKRARAALSQAKLHLSALVQMHERLRIKLAAYWGETSPIWNRLDGDLYTFGSISSFASLYERAQASPAIAVFANSVRLKKAEVALAKTQSRSDLGWQLGVHRFEENGEIAFTAGVSVPLFSSKRNRGAVKFSLAAENEVTYERQTALLKLHSQLFNAYSQRQQYVAAVKAFRTSILPNLNSALVSTQQAYETGRYSYQDWIAAQKELLEAKRSLIENAAAASLNQAVIEQLIAEPIDS